MKTLHAWASGRSAVISDCGQYRYALRRQWAKGSKTAIWVLLNPSTADGIEDDPTIRRCIGFSKAFGCSAMFIANLYALRSTDPRGLLKADDPIGPENDWLLQKLAIKAHHLRMSFIVAAWGARGKARGEAALNMLAELSDVHCLGTTAGGAPRHPLYLPKATELVLLRGKGL